MMMRAVVFVFLMVAAPAVAQTLEANPTVDAVAKSTQLLMPFTTERGTCYLAPVSFVDANGIAKFLLKKSFPFGCDGTRAANYPKTVAPPISPTIKVAK